MRAQHDLFGVVSPFWHSFVNYCMSLLCQAYLLVSSPLVDWMTLFSFCFLKVGWLIAFSLCFPTVGWFFDCLHIVFSQLVDWLLFHYLSSQFVDWLSSHCILAVGCLIDCLRIFSSQFVSWLIVFTWFPHNWLVFLPLCFLTVGWLIASLLINVSSHLAGWLSSDCFLTVCRSIVFRLFPYNWLVDFFSSH